MILRVSCVWLYFHKHQFSLCHDAARSESATTPVRAQSMGTYDCDAVLAHIDVEKIAAVRGFWRGGRGR